MITTLLRLYLALATTLPDDAADEIAHRACEVTLYAIVAPGIDDDATTPLGEELAEFLCRNDPPPASCTCGDPDTGVSL